MMDQDEGLRQQLKCAETALGQNQTAENLARLRELQARLPLQRMDILQNLRRYNRQKLPVAHEAADEIERLRSALREIAAGGEWPWSSMARAALAGEKKND